MSRDIPSLINARLDDPFVHLVHFVHLDFDTDPIYVHTDIGNIAALGQTWLGVGDLGSIGQIEEGDDVSPYSVPLRFSINSNAAGSLRQEINTQDFYDRAAFIYAATRDLVTGALDGDPFELAVGRIDQMRVSDTSDSLHVDIIVESEMADFDQASLEYLSDASQQRRYPGDLFLQYLGVMVNKTVRWGTDETITLGSPRPRAPASIGPNFPR